MSASPGFLNNFVKVQLTFHRTRRDRLAPPFFVLQIYPSTVLFVKLAPSKRYDLEAHPFICLLQFFCYAVWAAEIARAARFGGPLTNNPKTEKKELVSESSHLPRSHRFAFGPTDRSRDVCARTEVSAKENEEDQ